MSTEPEAIACSIGGPEVKSDQSTWNGSVFEQAAVSTASAPVPFWSPTLSVTEDRFTVFAELDAGGLLVPAPELAVLDDDDEQPAAASPANASTVHGIEPWSVYHVIP